MCSTTTANGTRLSDYGEDLYSKNEEDGLFTKLFPNFIKEQEAAAKIVWDRIISHCGEDPDLPHITTVIDYGCGEGTFLLALAQNALAVGNNIRFVGVDISAEAIQLANKKRGRDLNVEFHSCLTCPEKALKGIKDIVWRSTALLSISHTWFHLDQKCLIKAVLDHRPALLLIDIYSTWDTVVKELSNSKPNYEHGRHLEVETYWLKTQRVSDGYLQRGISQQRVSGEPIDLFVTLQAAVTTEELLGVTLQTVVTREESSAVHKVAATKDPEKILNDGRSRGQLVDNFSNSPSEIAYVHRRLVHHDSGWGRMDCHVLTGRDPCADILNDAYFSVINPLVAHCIIDPISGGNDRVAKLLHLFDESGSKNGSGMTGSREALVLLPFDPNHTFARIMSLFQVDSAISTHPLLLELPSTHQGHFPSANGAFQRTITLICFAVGLVI